jgi:hypothetical protein
VERKESAVFIISQKLKTSENGKQTKRVMVSGTGPFHLLLAVQHYMR